MIIRCHRISAEWATRATTPMEEFISRLYPDCAFVEAEKELSPFL
jgi:hypothetical protein